jgi:NAD(P)-dependent dehydrogenase (short-subunit alcohol dehydrogenase family)
MLCLPPPLPSPPPHSPAACRSISKSALNQATKCMALELRRQGTWAFAYHPGTTDTDLSRPFQANVRADKLFTPAFTVGRVLDLCDCMGEEHSGGLYDYSGAFVLW